MVVAKGFDLQGSLVGAGRKCRLGPRMPIWEGQLRPSQRDGHGRPARETRTRKAPISMLLTEAHPATVTRKI